MAACDFDTSVQYRSCAGSEEVAQSPLMGFPVLLGDDGVREESPDGLLSGPAEYLLSLYVPLGDNPSCVHSDEAIERHFDDAPDMRLTLTQRCFSLSGERTFRLRMPIFPSHSRHGPH